MSNLDQLAAPLGCPLCPEERPREYYLASDLAWHLLRLHQEHFTVAIAESVFGSGPRASVRIRCPCGAQFMAIDQLARHLAEIGAEFLSGHIAANAVGSIASGKNPMLSGMMFWHRKMTPAEQEFMRADGRGRI